MLTRTLHLAVAFFLVLFICSCAGDHSGEIREGEHFYVTVKNLYVENYQNNFECTMQLSQNDRDLNFRNLFLQLVKMDLPLPEQGSFYQIEHKVGDRVLGTLNLNPRILEAEAGRFREEIELRCN